jgi:hypothetical protein
MATDAENIATIRANLLAALATESANPKPSYNIDGQQVDWNGYRTAILGQIAALNGLQTAAVGIFEEIGEATT